MTTLSLFLVGIIIGYLIIAIPKSIYNPKAMWIQSIKFFGKPFTYIENVNAKKFYKGKTETDPKGKTKWDLIDDPDYGENKLNIYFFLWPFFTIHIWEINYTRTIKPGEEKPGDIVLWKKLDKDGNIIEILVSRTRKTDHLIYRESYPMISTTLSTKELGNIFVISEPVLEVTNPSLALYSIANWLKSSLSILNAAQRGFVAIMNLYDLNSFSSEGGSEEFNKEMKKIANVKDDEHPGLCNLGIKLFKHTFEDFDPADDKTERLMESYADVTIASQEGEAKIIRAEKDGEADFKKAEGTRKATVEKATGEMEAFVLNQKAIIEWRKKFLIETGLAKVDADGNITELVPEANVRVSAEALKELAHLTGTLVMDSSGINKFLNINPTNPEK